MIENVRRVSRLEGRKDNKVALVFSCPGKVEEETGILVNGATGVNLEMLLAMLHESHPEIFNYTMKGDYRVTNSSDIVHYKNNGNGSEPSIREISDSDNLDRLIDDLKGYSLIFTCGKKANDAMKRIRGRLDNGINVIRIPHLGTRGLRRILISPTRDKDQDRDLTWTKMRLKILYEEIVIELKRIWAEKQKNADKV